MACNFQDYECSVIHCKFVFCYYKIDGISELSTLMLAGWPVQLAENPISMSRKIWLGFSYFYDYGGNTLKCPRYLGSYLCV